MGTHLELAVLVAMVPRLFTAIESSRIYIFTYISLMKHFRLVPPAPRAASTASARRDATLGQMLVLLCAIFVVYAHAFLLIFRYQWEVLQVRG